MPVGYVRRGARYAATAGHLEFRNVRVTMPAKKKRAALAECANSAGGRPSRRAKRAAADTIAGLLDSAVDKDAAPDAAYDPAQKRPSKKKAPKQPAFDKDLTAAAIRKDLRPHTKTCAHMTNGNWHDCYEVTDQEIYEFFTKAVGYLQRIHDIGVKELRAFGRCHAAMQALADLNTELEAVPLRSGPQSEWQGMRREFGLELARGGGRVSGEHFNEFGEMILFAWRCLLRAAASRDGDVEDLPKTLQHTGGVKGDLSQLEQMALDAEKYGCDIANCNASLPHSNVECGDDAPGCEKLRKYLKDRDAVFKKVLAEFEQGKPIRLITVPDEMLPDVELRVGAARLRELRNAGRYRKGQANYKKWEGKYRCRDGRF